MAAAVQFRGTKNKDVQEETKYGHQKMPFLPRRARVNQNRYFAVPHKRKLLKKKKVLYVFYDTQMFKRRTQKNIAIVRFTYTMDRRTHEPSDPNPMPCACYVTLKRVTAARLRSRDTFTALDWLGWVVSSPVVHHGAKTRDLRAADIPCRSCTSNKGQGARGRRPPACLALAR